MKITMRSMQITALAVLALAATAHAQSEEQLEEDAEKIHGLHEQVMAIEDFRFEGGRRIGENAPAFQQARERLEATQRLAEQHEEYLQALYSRYRVDPDNPSYARRLNRQFEPTMTGYDTGDELQAILDRFQLAQTAPRELAMKCLNQLQETGTNESHIRALHSMYQTKAIEEAQQLLEICPRMAPSIGAVQRRVQRLRAQVEELLAKFEEERRQLLEARQWESSVRRLSGGSPRAMAQAAKRWLNAAEDWGRNRERQTRILAVSVTGDWFVAERNLLGQPTRWGLPVHVAVTDSETDDDVARVYELSMITNGPQKNGSFLGPWVGEVWEIYRNRVPRR